MWKLVYEPSAKFCTDDQGNDLVFTSEEQAMDSIKGLTLEQQDNYRGFDLTY